MTVRRFFFAVLLAVSAVTAAAAPAAAAPPTQAPTDVRLTPVGEATLMVVLWWNAAPADPPIDRFQVFIHPDDDLPFGGAFVSVANAASAAARMGGFAAYAQDQQLLDGQVRNYAVRSCNADGCGPWSGTMHHDGSFVGDGHVRPVEGDSPAEAIAYVRDYGTENAPIFIAVIGAIFAVGTTFWLVRRGLARSRGAMRL